MCSTEGDIVSNDEEKKKGPGETIVVKDENFEFTHGMSEETAKEILSEREFIGMSDIFVNEIAREKLRDSLRFTMERGRGIAISEEFDFLADEKVRAFFTLALSVDFQI